MWSQDKPNECGFYWYRNGHADPVVVFIESRHGKWWVAFAMIGPTQYVTAVDYNDEYTVEDCPGEWNGPLTPPEDSPEFVID